MRRLAAFLVGFLAAAWLSTEPFSPPADFSMAPFVQVQDADGEFTGSGEIVYSAGGRTFVLTAGHVADAIDGEAVVKVFQYDDAGRLVGSRNISGCVVANTWDKTPWNERTDLALILLDSDEAFEPVRIHSGPVPRHLWAVGSPAGVDPIAVGGELSSTDYFGTMRTSTWIFPGSSGGAVCARTGRGWELCGVSVMTWMRREYLVGYACLSVGQEDVRGFLADRGLLGGGD